jgi:hypothetical protein
VVGSVLRRTPQNVPITEVTGTNHYRTSRLWLRMPPYMTQCVNIKCGCLHLPGTEVPDRYPHTRLVPDTFSPSSSTRTTVIPRDLCWCNFPTISFRTGTTTTYAPHLTRGSYEGVVTPKDRVNVCTCPALRSRKATVTPVRRDGRDHLSECSRGARKGQDTYMFQIAPLGLQMPSQGTSWNERHSPGYRFTVGFGDACESH